MSSDRLERKRRSEFDNSDDSADELPPAKIQKTENSSHFRKVISDKFKNLLNWLTPTSVKNYMINIVKNSLNQSGSSTENMGMADGVRNSSVEDDEDNEIAVIAVQNGTAPRTGIHQKHNNHSKSVVIPVLCDHLSASLNYPEFTELSRARYPERKPMNGIIYKGKTIEHYKNKEEKSSSPIVNPNSELDMKLEGKTSKEDKDIEILCEVPLISRKSKRMSDFSIGSTKDKVKNAKELFNKTNVCPRRTARCQQKSTAEEVLRLSEKNQYQMLLNKVMKQSYLPFKRPTSYKSTIEVDLTEDEDNPPTVFHFKKEKVENSKEFVSKYMKPCGFVPYSSSDSHRSFVTKSTSDDDENDEDEIQVIADLPKFKPRKRISNGGFFSQDWIEELKATIETDKCKQMQLVAEQNDKLERYKKRRDAKIAEHQKKLEDMKLAGIIYPEDVEMEEEVFPEITPDMEKIIQAVLSPGNPSERMCSIDRMDLTRNDMHTLAGLNWLNDQVINFYMTLIVERSKSDNYPSVYAYSSFFYTSMKTGGNKRVMRWTKKIDIFSYDLLFAPLHLGLHWALIAIDNRSKTVTYYDSMGCSEEMCLRYIRQYLIDEMLDKKKQVLDPNAYSYVIAKDIPKQMNGSDCGMFTLKYAEYLSRDAPITFTQNHMPYFRMLMVYELLNQQILM